MIAISDDGVDGLPDAMTVMTRAFDPQYGEAWTASQCTGVLSMPGAQLLIARKADGAPLGFAMTRTVIDETELMLLAVVPEMRGRGIGRALLQHSIDSVTATGAASYFLEVRSDNPAIEFYEQVGLRQVGVRRDYYRGNDGYRRDALTYRLSLG
jgi:[ribosomal protein S18]-alanine N-acetyltransferase